MLTFVRLRENNEWEGETWNHWLQVNGNEQALEQLADVVEALSDDFDETFSLGTTTRTEGEVDLLVEESDEGYMMSHNKVVGKLVIPKPFDRADRVLNKGGIENLFKEVDDR